MKIYLVGGAVRDQLLGLPIIERDWVVVGATPEALIQQGYKQVGRDFPVFLHPVTREEYALARTERKVAHGYRGFVCDFSPNVSLAEDLLRRDLTINAMAQDANGKIFDPYHGMRDLREKWLRHVSPAFAEDPVRVLRVARFAARYHYLGFRLADETRVLMHRMVCAGELQSLVAERVWQEWQRALTEQNPEWFLRTLRVCGALEAILPELDGLFGVPNPPRPGRCVDTGIQTLQTLMHATQGSHDPLVRFAVLLLALGKQKTPVSQWPLHVDYGIPGALLIRALSERLRIPTPYRELACLAARWHETIMRLAELDAVEVVRVFEQADAFRRPERFATLLCVCQVSSIVDAHVCTAWQSLLECARRVRAVNVNGTDGASIKQALHARRLICIAEQLNLLRISREK